MNRTPGESARSFSFPSAERATTTRLGREVVGPWCSGRCHAKDRLIAVPAEQTQRYRSLYLAIQVHVVHFNWRCCFVDANLGMHHHLAAEDNLDGKSCKPGRTPALRQRRLLCRGLLAMCCSQLARCTEQ